MKAFAGQLRNAVSKRCHHRLQPVPTRVAASLRHGDLIFASEPLNLALPLDRAIREVGVSTIRWLNDRGVETSHNDATAEHVAMVVADGSGHATSVVEAVRLLGVRVLSLEGFFDEFVEGTEFWRGQVTGTSATDRAKAVSFALQRTGAEYAYDFAPPSMLATTPWSQKYYCSSLVDFAYQSALGETQVFSPEPFPLMFEPRSFWEEYYKEQSQPVPTGFGSNPTLLMHSKRLTISKIDFSVQEPKEEIHELF